MTFREGKTEAAFCLYKYNTNCMNSPYLLNRQRTQKPLGENTQDTLCFIKSTCLQTCCRKSSCPRHQCSVPNRTERIYLTNTLKVCLWPEGVIQGRLLTNWRDGKRSCSTEQLYSTNIPPHCIICNSNFHIFSTTHRMMFTLVGFLIVVKSGKFKIAFNRCICTLTEN